MSERRPRPSERARIPAGLKPKYNAVIASATRLTRGKRIRRAAQQAWQAEAWDFYDSNETLRFAVGWIANGLSRINLGAARVSLDGTDPTPLIAVETGPGGNEGDSEPKLSDIERDAVSLVTDIGGGPKGQAQMLARLATLLTVPGIGWLLIEPKPGGDDGQWAWRVLSDEELKQDGDEWQVETTDEDDIDAEWRPLAADHVLVKVWRSHPRRAREPDSNCRAIRRTLRQLSKLDDHVDATADSRLAGNGLLVVPEEVKFAPVQRDTDVDDPDADEDEATLDDFMELLSDAMVEPIHDRGVASSVVPLAITVPGEYVDKIRHITFWSEFSDTVIQLSERAVKRLALGLDMPPEVVTGISTMNHWGAWRVQEEAVTLHIEPLSEIICQALTIGFLWPTLEAMGYERTDVEQLLVVGDSSTLTVRPDRSSDTRAAYDNLEVSGAVLRRESGLSEDDKPSDEEWQRRWLMRMADRNPEMAPAVARYLGIELPDLGARQTYPLRSLDGRRAEPVQPIGGPPNTDDAGPAEPAIAASADSRLSAALFEACDGIVHRALERAGSRLRAKAGRNVPGGTATIAACDPVKQHTKLDAATFADISFLLEGALDRVPIVADRLGLDPEPLTASLHIYLRDLLVSGAEHTPEGLASSLLALEAA